jgi:ubiquinone/menaquinone biosynthesis C-methylase UbiE
MDQRLKIDEKIYLNETRKADPKQCFVALGDILEPLKETEISSIDIGCATGELTHYLTGRFPKWKFSGADVSANMINVAQEIVPSADFFVGSVTEPITGGVYDLITCVGVLTIFDEIDEPLNHLINATNSGGKIIIFGNFNPDPIDIRARVCRSGATDWSSGYNVWSKQTFEKIITKFPRVNGHKWTDFNMAKAIPKTDDPLRVWTVELDNEPHHQVRGSGQLVRQSFLEIIL